MKKNMNNILETLKAAEILHSEKRFAQLSNDDKQTVSEHSWMLSLMAVIFADRMQNRIDLERALKLCVIHDLPEAKTGDTPLHAQEQSQDLRNGKYQSEKIAMESFRRILGNSIGQEILDLWVEFEEGKTPEARFVRKLDKLEVRMQAFLFSKTIDYLLECEQGLYFKILFSDKMRNEFTDEPALLEFFDAIISQIEIRVENELGLNPNIFRGYNPTVV